MSTVNEQSLKPKRTVQKLTNGDRKWICKRRQTHKDEKFMDMQAAFRDERNPAIELKSGTVSGILKQSDKWLAIADGQEAGTRTRSSKEPELEAALFAWRNEQIAKDEKVRDEDLRDKARELAAAMGINTDRNSKGLSFSSGWLDRFKKRNCIKQTRYNRHGKKDAEKADQQSPAFPELSPPSAPHDPSAASVGHNVPPVAHGALHYAHPPHVQTVMPAPLNVSGIPPVPHAAALAQPSSVPLPQADTFPLPQPDASIPQPPSHPSEHDDPGLLGNNGAYPGPSLYQQLVPQPPVGPPTDGANGAIPPVPVVSPPTQPGIPLGSSQVPQVPAVPAVPYGDAATATAINVVPTHDPFHQQEAMGIPAPDQVYQQDTPADVPMSEPGPAVPQQQVPLKVEDEDIADIPPPADIPDDAPAIPS